MQSISSFDFQAETVRESGTYILYTKWHEAEDRKIISSMFRTLSNNNSITMRGL